KKVMVCCDIGRGLVMVGLPWVDTIPGLFFASLLLEVLTLMWGPAKDASVPNLVRPAYLATANSLGLIAAYGTFPVGALVFGSLTKIGERVLDLTGVSGLPQETVPLLFDAGTYVVSGLLIATLTLRHSRAKRVTSHRGLRVGETLAELAEGWKFIGKSRVVRSVMFGIATGLIGGGMLVPLGKPFVEEVLGGGAAGFGLLLGALGTGVAVGIVALSVAQSRLPHERLFTASVIGAAVSIIAAASMSSLTPAIALVVLLGVFAGGVYVLGFTILQANVEDDLRGRTFAAFYTLIRLCLLLAFAVGGVLSGLLGGVASRLVGEHVMLFDLRIAVPGVRLALWLAGLIILGAGIYTSFALRARSVADPASPQVP
ncbi:MAG TPA: MFS transporter, partial [Acidimicrobiales bacterium]|nr:MFS transporter [Acidimicrobiales bacterium]